MVNYRRNLVAGGTYFFTVNLEERHRGYLIDYVSLLRRAVFEIKQNHPFNIDAMVILPDHLHAVWTMPHSDFAYARRLQLIKARFTQLLLAEGVPIREAGRGEYRLWQKRYWEHTIRDESDFEAHINYVHINPVKHGYVARAIDWQYSSIHRYVKNGILTADWACTMETGDFGE
jgi:putative transposase